MKDASIAILFALLVLISLFTSIFIAYLVLYPTYSVLFYLYLISKAVLWMGLGVFWRSRNRIGWQSRFMTWLDKLA